ncbi:MAG: hypothetical protein E6G42_08155 [Actinobacteria bacterium]|nr:MAG: hypothetical protein E6G42_08155 [Actinomycetota bacterium]
MGWKLVSALALVCVVIAAGCGGSSKKSALPTTTVALGAKFAQALQATSGSAETRVANDVRLFQAFANAAPSEVRGDFQTLATAFNGYMHALLKAGIKPGKIPTAAQIAQLQSAARAFSTPKLKAAEQHLSAWAHKNCGTAVQTTTG